MNLEISKLKDYNKDINNKYDKLHDIMTDKLSKIDLRKLNSLHNKVEKLELSNKMLRKENTHLNREVRLLLNKKLKESE